MQINHFVHDEISGGTSARGSKAALLFAAACGLASATDAYRATAMQPSAVPVMVTAVETAGRADRTATRNVLHQGRQTAFPPTQDSGLGFLALLAAASSATPGR